MSKQGPVGDQLSRRIRVEREHRGWSQTQMAEMLDSRHTPMHWTTISKIEKGVRSVRVDEAVAIADLFGITITALMGRGGTSESDLLWAVSRLCSTAGKLAAELAGLHTRLTNEINDVTFYGSAHTNELVALAYAAAESVSAAQLHMTRLSDQFPIPGVSGRTLDRGPALAVDPLGVERGDELAAGRVGGIKVDVLGIGQHGEAQ